MLIQLLAQLSVVLSVAWVFGRVFKALGQPPVVGEILAGIALGPTLLGKHAPGLEMALFPAKSLGVLDLISQIGLILFVFILGAELEIKLLRRSAKHVIAITAGGIILSMGLAALAAYIYWPASEAANIFKGVAFISVAAGATALPVLARIVDDSGLLGSRLGQLSIACAMLNDALTWIMLSAFMLFFSSKTALGFGIIPAIALYAMCISTLGKKVTRHIANRIEFGGQTQQRYGIAICLVFILCSSTVTDLLGLHSLFGALIAGLVVPRSRLVVERLKLVFLGPATLMLPVFFALVGLRTDFSKILGGDLPMLTLAIIIASIAGKIFGALLAGVVSRISIKASLTLGVLMNTRGMIELVILNIGFDLGFIGAQPFASMIAMTIVTTLMTGLILPFLRSGFDAIEVVPGNEALSKA